MTSENCDSERFEAATTERWPENRILAEARRRTRELNADNSRQVQSMLDGLLQEAGWTEEQFIDALCKDVTRKGLH